MYPYSKKIAFKNLEDVHTPQAIEKRLQSGPQHNYIKDFIYGAVDGAVTTFAVISGVAGAELSSAIVIVLGVANVIADGFSMAISNFLGTRAEIELVNRARKREEEHIEKVPEGEREEIRQIFSAKGFQGEDLEQVVKVITSDKKIWVDTMLTEELGLPLDSPSPLRAAGITFISFILVGALPLIPFIADIINPNFLERPFLWSALLTGFAFYIVGALKSKFVEQSWFRGGIETFLVGACAAILAYGTGTLLKGLVK